MKPRFKLHSDGSNSLLICSPEHFAAVAASLPSQLTGLNEAEIAPHPEQIKAAMRMAGVTPAALADSMLVAKSTVSQVINGRTESARIKARIAEIVGQPVVALWPEKVATPLRRTKAAAAKRVSKPARRGTR